MDECCSRVNKAVTAEMHASKNRKGKKQNERRHGSSCGSRVSTAVPVPIPMTKPVTKPMGYPYPWWTLVGVQLNPVAIELFRWSQHPYILQVLYNTSSEIRTDDRVHAIAGQFRGLEGCVIEIQEDRTLQFVCENLPSMGVLTVSVWEVQKCFLLGDYVEVRYGEYRCLEGFIVSRDDPFAIIYVCGPMDWSGCEVSHTSSYFIQGQINIFYR